MKISEENLKKSQNGHAPLEKLLGKFQKIHNVPSFPKIKISQENFKIPQRTPTKNGLFKEKNCLGGRVLKTKIKK